MQIFSLFFFPIKGVKNADINELKEIASEPDSTHVYNVADFNFMHTIVEGLTRTVCSRVEEQEKEIKGEQKQNFMWLMMDVELQIKYLQF